MDDHWLARGSTIKWLWRIFAVGLAATLLADAVISHHAQFGIDGIFGFGAWFGFTSCVLLIVGAKALGSFLKRPDTYYDH